MARSALTRQQKLFKFEHILPLDANNIDVEEAMSRLFVYLRTNGRQIMRTDKPVFSGDSEDAETPAAVVDAALMANSGKLEGISDDRRKALIVSWVESHFALMARRGKSKGGEFRMSGLRPLHFAVIKLFNPRVKRQDRQLSDFYYNILRDDQILFSNPDSLLKKFFGLGVKNHGETDYIIDEDALARMAVDNKLDVELVFLLRLAEPFEVDRFSSDEKFVVKPMSFLCPEQVELLKKDLGLLLLYRDHIPRRDLINYMTTLMVFHAALYLFQVVKIANWMVEHGSLPVSRGGIPSVGEPRTHAPFDIDLFCDVTNGQNAAVKELSERSYLQHFKEIESYFRSAYYMKKLDGFASSYLTTDQRNLTGRAYIDLLLKAFRNHPDLNGYFNRDIQAVIEAASDDETHERNEDIDRVIDVCNRRKLNKLEMFVEILLHFQHRTLREQHRKLLAGLCGVDQERGFLTGKGRARRRFVLGNELLEVLVQLAVVEQRACDQKFETRPIPIRQFVDWMAGRYGLLVDRLSIEPNGDPEQELVNRALAKNYEALKNRLRQLGFFTDLADASNSQVIHPRFAIDLDEGEAAVNTL